MDPYVGEIRQVAFSYAPASWALCNGALLSIRSYTALYSLLGTQFGGDGVSTFGLPNLTGRAAVGTGQGPGTSAYSIGQVGGATTVSLLLSQMPAHVHTLPISTSSASPSGTPSASVVLGGAGGGRHGSALSWYVTPQVQAQSPTNMAATAVGLAGGGQPHNNVQPCLTINYIIALQGIYPSRP